MFYLEDLGMSVIELLACLEIRISRIPMKILPILNFAKLFIQI